jgi:predicted NAD-dependent protein-ADP-ribosyltransferase YbiA (DUF1768 family)
MSTPMMRLYIRSDVAMIKGPGYKSVLGDRLVPGLSNMKEDGGVTVGGVHYRTREGAYQALRSDDRDFRTALSTCSGYEAKQYAKAHRDMQYLNDDISRYRVMKDVIVAAYKENMLFKTVLDSTAPHMVVEIGRYDQLWGVIPVNGGGSLEGCNYLGRLMTGVREGLVR